jgi:hypothetical protein
MNQSVYMHKVTIPHYKLQIRDWMGWVGLFYEISAYLLRYLS